MTALPRDAFVGVHMQITASLVRHLGGNTAAASVLVTIEFRARMYGFEYDGYRWWRANREEIAQDTGLSVKQVDRLVAKLLEGGYVVREKFEAHRSDHTYSYRIVYEDGGSMPSMYQARQAVPAGLMDRITPSARIVGNTDVPESGDQATPDVPISGVPDVPDSGVRDVPISGVLPSVKKVNNQKNPSTVTGSAGDPDGVDVEAAFAEFWSVWPRLVKKAEARLVFEAIVTGTHKPKGRGLKRPYPAVEADAVIEGARRFAADVRNTPADKIPHPTSWLNDRRWEDEAYSTTQRRVGVPQQSGRPANQFQPADDYLAQRGSFTDDDPWATTPDTTPQANSTATPYTRDEDDPWA